MKTLMIVLALMVIDLGAPTDANTKVSYTKADFQHAIYRFARKNKMNPAIALAVAQEESTWNPDKERPEPKGNTFSVGLFQMYMPTAKDMGFKGSKEGLKNPDINIRLGVEHLAKCQRKYGNDVRRVACCHNAGIHIRDSVCRNDGWVIHYENKVERSYKEFKNYKL